MMVARMLSQITCNNGMVTGISSIQFTFSIEVNMYYIQLHNEKATSKYICLENVHIQWAQ